uniref:Bifunctional pinoresinol-lariciresinol reductase 1-like n=1 Tax=Elaeis guineensis var. tenera TaxID=51953 RepID=A0A8N4F105_ELAGV|nr:bifunctional pinoresinol-lariciresinol reductase 1-like [Elaeis guineensis]
MEDVNDGGFPGCITPGEILAEGQDEHVLDKSTVAEVRRSGKTKSEDASLEDHESMVSALKQVDVVVSAVGGSCIMEQLKLIEAIEEVGTIKRFLPSEFGMDVDRMEHAISPGDRTFVEKRVIRRAIEKANIPHTYVSANCFASIFLAGLAQLATYMPKRERVNIHGHGDKKCIWVAEEDKAMYAMLAVDDPRTLNKVLFVRPPANILTQMEVVKTWERIIGQELQMTFLSAEEWLSTMDTDQSHRFAMFTCHVMLA